MNELISLTQSAINGELQQTVNARELHGFLESKQDFSTWIKNRIEQYDFVENQDYTLLHKKMEQVSGAKHLIEYHITLDMAKELAMVERNDKGKQARQYFIECERKLREHQVKLAPKTYVEALRALADEVEAHNKTQELLAIAAPKSEYFDKLVERNLLSNFTITAKEFGIKRKDLIDYLLTNKYVYRDAHGNIVAYAAHVPTLFEIKEFAKEKHAGTQTLITPRGRETFRLLLDEKKAERAIAQWEDRQQWNDM